MTARWLASSIITAMIGTDDHAVDDRRSRTAP